MARSLNEAARWMQDASFLDPASEKFRRISQSVLGRGKLSDILGGTWLGHPAHPAMVLLPTGCWLASTVLDLSGRSAWRPAATRLIQAGLVAAVPTALTGANDWRDAPPAERRVGIFHASINYIGVGLALSSWRARRSGHHELGVVLSLGVDIALLAAGWLGGYLAYTRGVGVSRLTPTATP